MYHKTFKLQIVLIFNQPKLLHLTMADDNDFVPSLTADDSLSSFSMTCVLRQSVNICFKRFGDELMGFLSCQQTGNCTVPVFASQRIVFIIA